MANLLLLLLLPFFVTTPAVNSIFSDSITTSLSSTGFALFVHALRAHNLTSLPTAATRLTFLAPLDSALINHRIDDRFLLSHVSPAGALPYESLLSLTPNSTLSTLHQDNTFVVRSNRWAVRFNDIPVVAPNLYVDDSCAVHGVDGPLVPASLLPPPNNPPKPRTEIPPSPPRVPRRKALQISAYSRFVRRRNRPIHVAEKWVTTNSP
ncbi:hypothetical protein SLE2022_076430 [Rubroshorea leprosula]